MRAVALAIAALLVASASAEVFVRPENGDCIAAASTDSTLFPSDFYVEGDSSTSSSAATKVEIAVGFTVTYFDTYKVVNNTISNQAYVLSQCGAASPPNTTLTAGLREFVIPLTSVSVPETVPYAFLELLGVADRVHSVSSFVTSPCGQLLATSCGQTAPEDFFTESSNATWLSDEFASSVDGLVYSSELDLGAAFTFSAAQDSSALARAEWIKFLGVFFNLDAYASKVYDAIEARFVDLVEVAAAAVEDGEASPTVAFALSYDYGTDLGAGFQISFAPYKLDLIESAGGVPLNFTELLEIPGVVNMFGSDISFAYGTGAGFETREEALAAFLEALQTVDVFVDETFAVNPTEYDLEAFLETFSLVNASADLEASLPWLANLTIYREDGLLSETLGLDWFEGALVRADLVLRDFVRAILGPGVAGTDEFTWIRSIHETPVVVGPSDCAAAKGLTGTAACEAAPATICPYVSFCPDGTAVTLPESATFHSTNSNGTSCVYASCA